MFAGVRSIGLAVPRLVAAAVVIGVATFAAELPAQVAGAANDTVTTCNGSGPGSLPAVVGAAASGDTVTFSVSCPPSSPITVASTIDIDVNLTIDGPGASDVAVSGNNAVEVFDVSTGVNATISGVTIEKGLGTRGGGIANQGMLTVTNVTLAGNSAPAGYGAGVYNNGTASISKSKFIDNTASGGYGAGFFNNDTATVSDSTFIDNSATSDFGGGIGNYGTLMVANSSLSGNSSTDGGGFWNFDGMMTVTDSTVSVNTADNAGGGVFNEGGSLVVAESTLSDNTSTTGAGGGISNSLGTMNLSDSTLFDNTATGSNGGGGGILDNGAATVTASTISGNAAPSGSGGGIDVDGGTMTLAATIVANSTSGDDCSATVTDAGYNLDDDGSCGFSAANGSESAVNPDLGPLQNNGGPTETLAPELGSPLLNRIPLGTMANGVTLCPGTDQRGVSRPQGSECDIGAVEVVIPQAITSPNNATATTGSHFSFPVTTSGNPVPTITEKGTLPKKLTFTDNGNGTATISGKPKTPGVYHLTIKAKFGSGANKYVVSQAFTLTVASG